MPRRISDYPDAFLAWNVVSSFGSIVSVGATIIFFVTVYKTFGLLNNKGLIKHHIDYSKQYFESEDELTLKSRGFHSLEWILPNPPLLHTFEELPINVIITE